MPRLEAPHLICQEVIEERDGVWSIKLDPSHMGDVKESHPLPDRRVLLDDAGVLHRHRPAGKVDHPPAVSPMPLVKNRLIHELFRKPIVATIDPPESIIDRWMAVRVVVEFAPDCLVSDVPLDPHRVAFWQHGAKLAGDLAGRFRSETCSPGMTSGEQMNSGRTCLSSGMGFAKVAFMLTIGDDLLPQTDLTYFAFRVAFCDTLERITLAEQARMGHDVSLGYLTEVPFLRNVTPGSSWTCCSKPGIAITPARRSRAA